MKRNNVMAAGMTCLVFAGFVLSQDVNPLKKVLKDTHVEGPWIYNDLGSGFAAAKKTGKPMLVVFR